VPHSLLGALVSILCPSLAEHRPFKRLQSTLPQWNGGHKCSRGTPVHRGGWRFAKQRAIEPHTLVRFWRPWMLLLSGKATSPFGTCLGRKTRAAARIAGPVVLLCAVPGLASAQNDATWVGNFSDDWNAPLNWDPNRVPTGTATFGPPSTVSITFTADLTV
jgi:hypothetical protein